MIQTVFTVLVNWNAPADTTACVASLLAAGLTAAQIIIVDNGSTDGSVATLQSRFGPDLPIIVNAHNLGYAVACNQGVAFALAHGAAWVLLLNNDTVVAQSLFDELAQAAEHYAIITPLIFEYQHPSRIWSAGDRRIPGTLITLPRYGRHADYRHAPAVVPVAFITGCAMLIRRTVFERVGAFSTDYFMYAEDADFCWRAHLAGLRIACATRAHVWHKVSASAGHDRPLTRYLRTRNQIWFYRRFTHGLSLAGHFVFTLLRIVLISIGERRVRQPELSRALLHGWADGWASRPQEGRPSTDLYTWHK